MTTQSAMWLDQAVQIVLTLLPRTDDLTSEDVAEQVTAVVKMMDGSGRPVDAGSLTKVVESLIVIVQPDSDSLVDPEGHVNWLDSRRGEISWGFWNRYRRYLEERPTPPSVVRQLDRVTDRVLGNLEDPARPGLWDRRGLVVGQVQSGKTSNYIGLVCKAADAGYRLIVVMAGIHNSLRSQTQLRLDEGFLGFDTQYQHRSDTEESSHLIGVGAQRAAERLWAGSLTTSKETGDFKAARARSLGIPVVDRPVLLVVKKNTKIIGYIHDWITGIQGVWDSESKRRVVHGVPLLVIDDEADNASIDTSSDGSVDPTPTNREIRRLLDAFDRSAYVGYTATPFANIFVDPDEDHDRYGRDIFPRSFIELLHAPTNYFGPARMFGNDSGVPAPPILVEVGDYEDWMPYTHRKGWDPPSDEFPASLDDAISDFVLSNATRRARGQPDQHNSMLIHVTRFQDVQRRVAEQVQDRVLALRDRLRYGDAPSEAAALDELRDRWASSFEPTTDWFAEGISQPSRVSWDEVGREVLPALEKIAVRTMNGYSKEALDYYEQRETGLSVIAIGGNKLSRGLTLEGLSVSYYLRASRMYDTLMQMGRWFGYRDGYEDLCRLYTTRELVGWYREINAATAELEGELEEMVAQRATPREYGLRVRASPAGLSITAANKMRNAERVKVSFSGAVPETVLFDVRSATLAANEQTLSRLVELLRQEIGEPTTERDNWVWKGVSGELVAEHFFARYRADPLAWRVRPALIASYVERANLNDELRDWTVVLVSKRDGTPAAFGGLEVGLTERGVTKGDGADDRRRDLVEDRRYVIRRILSPIDEAIDVDEQQYDDALVATQQAWEEDPRGRINRPTSPSGPNLRAQRRPDQGLLLIYPLDNTLEREYVDRPMVGFCASFPHSNIEVDAEYAVNAIWAQLQDEALPELEDER